MNSENSKETAKTAFDMSGSIVGAVLGERIGGPAGMVVGAATGPITARAMVLAALGVAKRFANPKEEQRVATALTHAAEIIRHRKAAGEVPRSDSSWAAQAEEIAEGVIGLAQKEPEERKLKYLGAMLASFAFDPKIDRSRANFFYRKVEKLSYRQLVLLAYFSRLEELNVPIPPAPAPGAIVESHLPDDVQSEVAEMSDLLEHPNTYAALMRFNPYEHRPTERGRQIFYLAGLKDIPVDEMLEAGKTELRPAQQGTPDPVGD
jgi:hypothetical protein